MWNDNSVSIVHLRSILTLVAEQMGNLWSMQFHALNVIFCFPTKDRFTLICQLVYMCVHDLWLLYNPVCMYTFFRSFDYFPLEVCFVNKLHCCKYTWNEPA